MLKLNGTAISGASAKIRVGNTVCNTIQAVNYKESLEGEEIDAMGTEVSIGDTDGVYRAEGDTELLTQEARLLIDELAAQRSDGAYAKVKFDLLITYDNGVDPIVEVKLARCRIKSAEDAHAAGAAKLTTKLPLRVHWIERNGQRMAGRKAFEGIL